ncbi:hypothetical protein [Actinoplanes siamensis]|uniref:hypothetical protein n=1 Tax=Actinoplanes siamensis TaxID=1223317 RepID=UPI001941695A|nr:hypothetical protein [Actinoplanes siamensis]
MLSLSFNLFGVLKAQRLVFVNPLTRIHVGSANPSTPAALTGDALNAIGNAVENDPAPQTVALIAVHALRLHQVRSLRSIRSIHLTSASTWAPPRSGPLNPSRQ